MDVKIVTKMEGLEALTRKYPDASKSARVSRITEALLLLESAVKKATPVGAGPIHLRDTIFTRVAGASGQAVMGLLGTPMEYGLPVEMGTKPHFPPVAPIQHWVEKKLGLSGSQARSVAFLIARSISKKGTKGAGMFTQGFKGNESAVMRILEMIPQDIIRAVNA